MDFLLLHVGSSLGCMVTELSLWEKEAITGRCDEYGKEEVKDSSPEAHSPAF